MSTKQQLQGNTHCFQGTKGHGQGTPSHGQSSGGQLQVWQRCMGQEKAGGGGVWVGLT